MGSWPHVLNTRVYFWGRMLMLSLVNLCTFFLSKHGMPLYPVHLHPAITKLIICFPERMNNNPRNYSSLGMCTTLRLSAVKSCDTIWSLLQKQCPQRVPHSACVYFIICFISFLPSFFFFSPHQSLFTWEGLEVWWSEQIAAESTSDGMTVISMLLNVERSPNVFVYAGQLICDSVRGRPTGRLKSLVMPEIIIMSLQLVNAEKQSMRRQVDTPQSGYAGRFCMQFCVYRRVFPEWIIWKCVRVCVRLYLPVSVRFGRFSPPFLYAELAFPNLSIYTETYVPW